MKVPTLCSPTNSGRSTDWEAFLNGGTAKERLMSRYLYEHLFLAHLYLRDAPDAHPWRMVRSVTPPGEPVHEIASRRPDDDPGNAVLLPAASRP